jgi:hypothetical protein
MRRLLLALLMLSFASAAQAQVPAGTWIKRGESPLAMVVEPAGAGIKISYKAVGPDRKPKEPAMMTMETQLDGKDAAVMAGDKPTGQTMAVSRVDATHTATVVKFQGKLYGTSKSELSADGKTLKVENEVPEGSMAHSMGQPAGKQVEYWDKQ